MKTLDRVWLWLAALALGFTGVVAPRDAAAWETECVWPPAGRDAPYYEERLSIDGFRAPYMFVHRSAQDDDRGGLFDESQGITNGHPELGEPYWYMSTNAGQIPLPYTNIFRVPYTEYLGHNFDYDQRRILMWDGSGGLCGHVGGIDYHVYRSDGTSHSFIAAGYDNCDNERGRIAFFDPDDIDGSEDLLDPVAVMDISDVLQKDAPWVSVRNDGRIYSSGGGNTNPRHEWSIFEFTIDWDDVRNGIDPVYESHEITLHDLAGNPLHLQERQGGDFSSDGQLFFFHAYEWGDEWTNGRIWVFDASDPDDWYLVKASSVSRCPFYLDDNPHDTEDDELEGISYYDMNGVSTYHPDMPRSELHSLVLHNFWGRDDNLTIHHFTSLVTAYLEIGIGPTYYDRWQGEGLWDGATLVLEPGTYTEETTLSGRNVRIISPNGTATIRTP